MENELHEKLSRYRNRLKTGDLRRKLNELLRVDVPGLIVEIIKVHNGYQVGIESENMKDNAGVFLPCIEEVHVENFGGRICVDADKGEFAWVPVHLRWKAKNGGTNGLPLVSGYYYFETQTWEFEDDL